MYVMLCYVMPCYSMPRHVVLCYGMLCCVMLCMLCYVNTLYAHDTAEIVAGSELFFQWVTRLRIEIRGDKTCFLFTGVDSTGKTYVLFADIDLGMMTSISMFSCDQLAFNVHRYLTNGHWFSIYRGVSSSNPKPSSLIKMFCECEHVEFARFSPSADPRKAHTNVRSPESSHSAFFLSETDAPEKLHRRSNFEFSGPEKF